MAPFFQRLRSSPMFAARFPAPYNQQFPDKNRKSAKVNREVEL
jgi:hypothetical protein